MMTNPIGGLTASSAAYNYMSSANSLIRLCSFKGGNSASSLASISSAEKNLTLGMLNDSFKYQAGLLMQESQDRITKANIKRTFSMFM